MLVQLFVSDWILPISPARAENIKIGLPSVTITAMPFFVAREHGFFQQEGLNAEMVVMPASLNIKVLLAGDIQYAATMGSAVAAAIRGINVRIVMLFVDRPLQDLVGAANISAISELKGKVLAISSRGGLQDIIMRRILTQSKIDPNQVNIITITRANYWGRHLARVDLYLENAGAGWRVFARAARTIPVDDRVVPDPEILKLGEPYDRETQAWLSRAIGESGAELTATEARFRDTAILDLIQRVQLEAGKADVSMAAVFNPDARIARGPVTVRDIAGLYVYENTLVVLEVTGQQLKEALEHSAKYFRAYEPGKTPAELVDEKIPAYNFDIAEGVTYTLNISKPFGERIENLQFQGKPLAPAQKIRLATNNYRVNGGGGYTMYKGAPVVYRSSVEIRELIIDWVERHKTIPTEPSNNWKIVP